MPLLRRQPFQKTKPPPNLRPDEEVFHSKLTNEIFRDYEAFFERIILCNSLVWSCSITGRSGLTYQEALECEEKAKKSLGAFPEYLRRPVLCIASLTSRTRLNDMNEEVYNFAKDRFFISELLEVVHRNQKRTAKVIKIMVPKNEVFNECDDEDVIILDKPKPKLLDVVDLTMSDSSEASEGKSKSTSKSSSKTSLKSRPTVQKLLSPEWYNYMVQFIDRRETVTVKASQCNRKKGSYTRDKCKLFLKQHCEPGQGLWRVKDRFLAKFMIGATAFEEVYAGPRPTFVVAAVKKRPAGSVEKVKKVNARDSEQPSKKEKKQLEDLEEAEIQKRLQKKQLTPQQKSKLLEQLRMDKQKQKDQERMEKMKATEEMKLQRKNERDAERIRKMETLRIRAEYLREWSKPRDDLACDDLKSLPEPTPVRTHIPEQSFGDALLLVEFFRTFESIVDVSDVFPEGITLSVLEKVVKEKDVNGPLFDLVKVLLTTIFELEEEEDIEEEEMIKELKNLSELDEKLSDASMDYLIKTATKAAQIPYECHGTALSRMTLDPYTMTEIVRLHLLSSGARASIMNAKFRNQERGGYTSLDDAGLDLRRKNPHLIESLSETNLFDLSPADKIKVLTTLTDQIMSCAAARDIIEDYADQLRMARADLRQLQLREIKYDREDQQVKMKRRCEEKARELERVQALAVQKQKERDEKQTDKTDLDASKEKEKEPLSNQEDSRTSSRLKAQTQIKDEEELQKKLEKLVAKNPEAVLSYSEEGLTPSQIRYLDDKKIEYRASQREEGKNEQAELQAAILRLQLRFATYPLGRDRMFRRYWLFGGAEGLFVEDQEEYLPADYIRPVRQNLTLNPHLVENIPANAVHNLHSLNQAMLSPTRGQNSLNTTSLTIPPSTQIVHVSSSQSPVKLAQTSQQSPVKMVTSNQCSVRLVQSSVQLVHGQHSPVKIVQASKSSVKVVQAVSNGAHLSGGAGQTTSITLGSTVKLQPTVGGLAVGPTITGTITKTTGTKLPVSPTPQSIVSSSKGSPTSDKENLVNGTSATKSSLQQNAQLSPVKIVAVPSATQGTGSPVKIITLSPTKTFGTAPKLTSPGSSYRSLLNSPQSCPAVDQILSAKRVSWAFYSTPEAVDELIEALNDRGFREKELKNVLVEQRNIIVRMIGQCDVSVLSSKTETEEEAESKQKAKTVALPQNYRRMKSQGIVKDDSAQEQMELTLREMLLDMEERIFFGSLGSIKVEDRPSWREALEQGSYSSQIEPDWPGKIRCKNEKMETDEGGDEANQAVRDLCMGLLQVEQGVDRRYLNPPLGETEKEKKVRLKALIEAGSKKEERRSKGGKREEEDNEKDDSSSMNESVRNVSILERWEESLMSSTSLCQIYLHMATLESSVTWSKSALNARCRLCRRKGDAEQMLLCDMCDRGHHMYCLKPKVTKVPEGDWFCPECRPKDVQRTPRKSRRRYEEEDEEIDEETEEEEAEEGQASDDSDDEDESDDGEEQEESQAEETEEDSGEESTEVVSEDDGEDADPEPVAPKIKMRTNKKTQQSAPTRGRKSTPVQASKTKAGKITPTASGSRRSSRGVNEGVQEVKKGRVQETPPTSRPQSRNNKRKSMDVNNSVNDNGMAVKTKRLSDGSKAVTSSTSRGNETSAKLRKLEDFLLEMIRMDDAWPFLKPVTRKEAPDYHDVIGTPMDFSKIRMKMNDHQYLEPSQLIGDVRLMFKNCERYNLPSADPAKAGVRLSKLFEKRVKEMNVLENGNAAGRRTRKN